MEDVEFTDEQEEALEDLVQRVENAIDLDIPTDYLMFIMMRFSVELAVEMEVTKESFLRAVREIFDEEYEENLIRKAEETPPLEE